MTTKTLYTTGTVTFTNGSAAVLGVGSVATSWVPGDLIIGADSKRYEIVAIADDTHWTIDRNYEGATAAGAAYQVLEISPDRNTTRSLAAQFSAIATALRTAFNFSGNDQVAIFDKTAAGNNSGIQLRSATVDKIRAGLFGDDNYRVQHLVGFTWTNALTVDAVTGAVTLPTAPDGTDDTGLATTALVASAQRRSGTIVCDATMAANVFTLTPRGDMPLITALVDKQRFSFEAKTSATTAALIAIMITGIAGSRTLYRRDNGYFTLSYDIKKGGQYVVEYDLTTNRFVLLAESFNETAPKAQVYFNQGSTNTSVGLFGQLGGYCQFFNPDRATYETRFVSVGGITQELFNGSAHVDGISGQSLALNTAYYAYGYLPPGVLPGSNPTWNFTQRGFDGVDRYGPNAFGLDVWTDPQGNICTLLGMLWTGSGAVNGILWGNQPRVSTSPSPRVQAWAQPIDATTGQIGSVFSNTTPQEFNTNLRIVACAWAWRGIRSFLMGYGYIDKAGESAQVQVVVTPLSNAGGAITACVSRGRSTAKGGEFPLIGMAPIALDDGVYQFSIVGDVTAGNCNYNLCHTVGVWV